MQRFENILIDEADLASGAAVAGSEPRRLCAEQRRLHLERRITSVRWDGIEARATVLTGTPFLEITREVVRARHDLVMMTAGDPQGLRNMVFGSTSLHLMRTWPCLAWVTKGASGARLRQPRGYRPPDRLAGGIHRQHRRNHATAGRFRNLTVKPPGFVAPVIGEGGFPIRAAREASAERQSIEACGDGASFPATPPEATSECRA
jgi:hypothetical protein